MSTSYTVPDQARTKEELELIANDLRHDIITMLEAAKSGHPGGSLSAAEIISAIWFGGLLRYRADEPDNPWIDHFILSKGHVVPVLYAAFHKLGWISEEDLLTLRHLGSKLQGHPDNNHCPGFEICSGSLGQGLSVASGLALGLKMDAELAEVEPERVFVLVGDGELQEGSNWEALMFAAHRGLDNLIVFLDKNNLQIDGNVDDVCSLGDIASKFAAFGLDVQEVDGHDVQAVVDAGQKAIAHTGSPSVVICNTVKGKGVSFMENLASWHGTAPDSDQAAQALSELDEARESLLASAKEA